MSAPGAATLTRRRRWAPLTAADRERFSFLFKPLEQVERFRLEKTLERLQAKRVPLEQLSQQLRVQMALASFPAPKVALREAAERLDSGWKLFERARKDFRWLPHVLGAPPSAVSR